MALSHHTTKPWRANQRRDNPGLQRGRGQTDQLYFHWLELSSIYRKRPHRPELCCLACVSSVHALDTRHVSPPHCGATRCVETRGWCTQGLRYVADPPAEAQRQAIVCIPNAQSANKRGLPKLFPAPFSSHSLYTGAVTFDLNTSLALFSHDTSQLV